MLCVNFFLCVNSMYQISQNQSVVGAAALNEASNHAFSEGSPSSAVSFLSDDRSDLLPLQPSISFGSDYSVSTASNFDALGESDSEYHVDSPFNTTSEFSSSTPSTSPSSPASYSVSTPDYDFASDSEFADDTSDDEYLPPSTSTRMRGANPRTVLQHVSSAIAAHTTQSTVANPVHTIPPGTLLSSTAHTNESYPRPPYTYTSGRTDVLFSGRAPPLSPSVSSTLKCPLCSFRAKTGRASDLRRHYECHYEDDALKYVCCGVRIDRAAEYGVTDVDEVYEHHGELRVGNCWRVFSRRDALLRHLKSKKCQCVCDAVSVSGRY